MFQKWLIIVAGTLFMGAEVQSVPESRSVEIVIAADKLQGTGKNDFVFDVKIPVAGRYRVEISAKGYAVLNVDDYNQNKDGRTYDITAAMQINSVDNFSVVTKDGSPLNIGLHPMKLNIREGEAWVDWIKFTLLKEHELTPYTLKQNLKGDEWVLVWSDEFNIEGAPNPTVWASDIGNWGWGNGERQYYTEGRSENARCEKGRLVIEARKDRPQDGWSSARLTTRGKMSFLYGRMECRDH